MPSETPRLAVFLTHLEGRSRSRQCLGLCYECCEEYRCTGSSETDLTGRLPAKQGVQQISKEQRTLCEMIAIAKVAFLSFVLQGTQRKAEGKCMVRDLCRI